MKVTIVDVAPGEEEEIIIKCNQLDERLMQLEHGEIYYFETVDQKVFAYCEKEVFETKSRIYELEEALGTTDFFRASKSVLLNLKVIKSLSPAFGGRIEAVLKNGEHVIISRQYVGILKQKLGL